MSADDMEEMHRFYHGAPTQDCHECNPTGDDLREAGQKQALDNPMAKEYARDAEWEIEHLTRNFGAVTADDVTARIGPPPNRYVLGAVFSKMVKQGVVEPVGYVKSTRRSSHGRRVTSYRGRR